MDNMASPSSDAHPPAKQSAAAAAASASSSLPTSAPRPSLLLAPGGPPATVVSPPTPVTPVDTVSFIGGSLPPSESLIIEEPEEYDSHADDTCSTTSSSFVHTPAQGSMNVPPQISVSRGNSSSSTSMTPGLTGDPLLAAKSTLAATPAPSPSSPHLYMPRIPSPKPPPEVRPSSVNTAPVDKEKRHRRRESSTHRVRETIYAEQRSTVDGARMVNQYRLGKNLGKGSYASVEHGIDVGTGIEYVSATD